MRLIDLQNPWFTPVWRRLVVTGLLVGWTGVELWSGNLVWVLIFGGLAVYAVHQFFIAFDPRPPQE